MGFRCPVAMILMLVPPMSRTRIFIGARAHLQATGATDRRRRDPSFRLLEVTAEAEAHRREHAVLDVAGLADAGLLEDVEALGVGGHDAVLDAVVDHLHEMPGARGTAVKVALFGRAPAPLAPGRARQRAAAGGERAEDWLEALHHL